jgi:hypothetical protein
VLLVGNKVLGEHAAKQHAEQIGMLAGDPCSTRAFLFLIRRSVFFLLS